MLSLSWSLTLTLMSSHSSQHQRWVNSNSRRMHETKTMCFQQTTRDAACNVKISWKTVEKPLLLSYFFFFPKAFSLVEMPISRKVALKWVYQRLSELRIEQSAGTQDRVRTRSVCACKQVRPHQSSSHSSFANILPSLTFTSQASRSKSSDYINLFILYNIHMQ